MKPKIIPPTLNYEQAVVTYYDIISGWLVYIHNEHLLELAERIRDRVIKDEPLPDIKPADVYREMTIIEWNDMVRHYFRVYLEKLRRVINGRGFDDRHELLEDIKIARDLYFDFLGVSLHKSTLQDKQLEDDEEFDETEMERAERIYEEIWNTERSRANLFKESNKRNI